MKSVYFDSPIVRSLAETPKVWNQLYDLFLENFGRTFRPVKSCYLFLEYIGFTKKKLKLPTVLKQPIFSHQEELAKMDHTVISSITKERVLLLDEELCKISAALDAHIMQQVSTLRPFFEERIEQMEKRVANFQGARKLLKVLFSDITSALHENFDHFVRYITQGLSWDAFCSIHPVGISLPLVRDRQLVYWLEFWENGSERPAGKIMDDQKGYFDMDFQSPYKEPEDMVDSELHTYLALGHRVDGEIHPIYALAYPPADLNAFESRNKLTLGAITRIEMDWPRPLVKQPGKLYILDAEAHTFKEAYEPMFKIPL